jgi:hypothetical protein
MPNNVFLDGESEIFMFPVTSTPTVLKKRIGWFISIPIKEDVCKTGFG